MGRSSGKALKNGLRKTVEELELAYEMLRNSERKKSAEVEYAICGCCPAGLVVYPQSVGDVLSTNCHQAFKENFEMFLRKQKDKNKNTSSYFKLKHEQRMGFACLTARFCKGASEESEKKGAQILLTIDKWADDLLEGFGGAETLLACLKDIANGVTRALAPPPATATVSAATKKVVITQPSPRPGEPDFSFTVPLQTLEDLQPGQGIPTGLPGQLLVKTETGQYQILVREGSPGIQPSTGTAVQPSTRTALQPSTRTTVQPSTRTTVQPSTRTALPPSTCTTLQSSTAVQPSTGSTMLPSSSTALEPSTSTAVKTSTSTIVQPSTMSTVQLSTSTTVQPSIKTTVQPSMSTTVQPSTSATVQPSTRATVQPSSSTTVQPLTRTKVQPPTTTTVQPSGTARLPSPSISTTVSKAPAPSLASTVAASKASSMSQTMTPDQAKVKCKNFLQTLLRLASDQQELVVWNVRVLIQGLIDGSLEPEVFTTKLQKELNSSPQPCLPPFLKKSLPYLQHSLATRELSIEGIVPPTITQIGKLPAAISAPPVKGQANLPRIPLDISIISEESYKDVKGLVISAHKWVVEQLDVVLEEFKQFRDGLEEKERKKYDNLVHEQNEEWREFDLGNLSFEELDGIIKEVQKDMDDIIARHNNQNKDIDMLVELIEGKKLGAIPKKKKEKVSKSKKKKNQEKECKDANNENMNEKDISTLQSDEKLEQLKASLNVMVPTFIEGEGPPLKQTNCIKNVKCDEEKTLSNKAKKKKNQEKLCRDANNNENIGEKDITILLSGEKIETFKSETSNIGIKNVKSDEEKAFLSDKAKMADELKKTVKALNITKSKLEETENRFRAERLKYAHETDELNKAMEALNITKAKLKETENQFRAERSKNAHENDLLRSKVLFNDFKKHRDILRQRQKNNFSVIDHLRASPEMVQTPEVQMALRSLHEFSARLLLSDQELSHQYTTLCQQVQTSNSFPELSFDMSCAEPPDLGSSYMNLLYQSILMTKTSATLPSSLTYSPLGSTLPVSHTRDGTQASRVTVPPVRSQGMGSLLPTESIGSVIKNGGTATRATTKNVKPRGDQKKDCSSAKLDRMNTRGFLERGGGDASVNPEDTSCSICFEVMDESNSFYLTVCRHRFHTTCLKQWLQSPRGVSSTCPMCRTYIVKENQFNNLKPKRRF